MATDMVQPVLLELLHQQCEENQPVLRLPVVAQEDHEITKGMRDGVVYILRSLKVWYDLPSDVLFISANLLDRFLDKMKVKPKHMPCLAAASFQMACQMICGDSAPEPTDILAISQCNRTLGDLNRMLKVITSKLGASRDSPPVTSIVFLRILHNLLSLHDFDGVYTSAVNEIDMIRQLEVIACDSASSYYKPYQVAIVFICTQFDSGVARLKPSPSIRGVQYILSVMARLQDFCHLNDEDFDACHAIVLGILARYNRGKIPYRQRLVWKLSNRTLRHLRPTQRLVKTLQTIDEHGQFQIRAP